MRSVSAVYFFLVVLSAIAAQAQTGTRAPTTSLSALPADTTDTDTSNNPGLHNESQIGYIVVGGNAKAQSFSGKQTTAYVWTKDIAKLTGHYLSAKAEDQTTRQVQGTAENWSSIARWEHVFRKDKFSGYSQAGLMGDRFIGIQLGQSYDGGGKYFWLANDKIKFFSELGYRYLHENLVKDHVTSLKESHFVRMYSQVDYNHTESVKIGLWMEYLPDLKDNQNYRFSFSPYLIAILSNRFSLKFAYEGYYRNEPVASQIPGVPNNVRFDFRHTTALIAKF